MALGLYGICRLAPLDPAAAAVGFSTIPDGTDAVVSWQDAQDIKLAAACPAEPIAQSVNVVKLVWHALQSTLPLKLIWLAGWAGRVLIVASKKVNPDPWHVAHLVADPVMVAPTAVCTSLASQPVKLLVPLWQAAQSIELGKAMCGGVPIGRDFTPSDTA